MSFNKLVHAYPSRYSGQGSVAKPNLRVIPIVATAAMTGVSLSSGVFAYQMALQVPHAGSCVMLDQNLAVGDLPGTVYVAFDEVTVYPNGTIANAFNLQPENVMDVRPGQFNMFSVYVTSSLSTLSAGTSFGRLILGDGFYLNQAGSGAGAAGFVQPGLTSIYSGTDQVGSGATSNGWAAVGGGTGIFQFRWINAAALLGAAFLGYATTIKNVGGQTLYVAGGATGATLSNGSDVNQLNQVFPIRAGEEETFEVHPKNASTVLTGEYVYSPDAAATLAYKTVVYGN